MNVSESTTTSTRPYMIRAIHEWCCDNGFSPYLAVRVDASVQVPMEFVQGGEIVLNVGTEATSSLRLGNDVVEFKARFGGVVREIIVPVDHVLAIYARENGQGMSFPDRHAATLADLEVTLSDLLAGDAEETGDLVLSSPSEPRGVLRVVPSSDGPTGPDAENGDGPKPDGPPRGGGSRPTLKRVK